MSKTIQLYTNKFTTEADSSDQVLITIHNVTAGDVISDFKSREVLDALCDQYDFSEIYDWVINRKGENDEN